MRDTAQVGHGAFEGRGCVRVLESPRGMVPGVVTLEQKLGHGVAVCCGHPSLGPQDHVIVAIIINDIIIIISIVIVSSVSVG